MFVVSNTPKQQNNHNKINTYDAEEEKMYILQKSFHNQVNTPKVGQRVTTPIDVSTETFHNNEKHTTK